MIKKHVEDSRTENTYLIMPKHINCYGRLFGGIGNVVGTIIGGVLSSVISTCITLLRVSSYWETIVTGAVVLIAVLIDAVKDNPVIKARIKRIFTRKA